MYFSFDFFLNLSNYQFIKKYLIELILIYFILFYLTINNEEENAMLSTNSYLQKILF
jgi:hypothetical protein